MTVIECAESSLTRTQIDYRTSLTDERKDHVQADRKQHGEEGDCGALNRFLSRRWQRCRHFDCNERSTRHSADHVSVSNLIKPDNEMSPHEHRLRNALQILISATITCTLRRARSERRRIKAERICRENAAISEKNRTQRKVTTTLSSKHTVQDDAQLMPDDSCCETEASSLCHSSRRGGSANCSKCSLCPSHALSNAIRTLQSSLQPLKSSLSD